MSPCWKDYRTGLLHWLQVSSYGASFRSNHTMVCGLVVSVDANKDVYRGVNTPSVLPWSLCEAPPTCLFCVVGAVGVVQGL